MSRKPATCWSCGAPITWAISTETGARIPIDTRLRNIPEETNLKGCFYLVDATEPAAVRCVLITPEDAAKVIEEDKKGNHSMLLYGINHFKTCPNPGRHRRK